jgi:hypothetical protein
MGGLVLLAGCAHGPTTEERLADFQGKLDGLKKEVEVLRFEVTQYRLDSGGLDISHGKRKRPAASPKRDASNRH